MVKVLTDESIEVSFYIFIDPTPLDCAFYEGGYFARLAGQERRFSVYLGLGEFSQGAIELVLSILWAECEYE